MHHNHYHNKTFQWPHFKSDLHFPGVPSFLWVTTYLMVSRKETKYIFPCFFGSSLCVFFSTGWSPPHFRNDEVFLGLFWCSQKNNGNNNQDHGLLGDPRSIKENYWLRSVFLNWALQSQSNLFLVYWMLKFRLFDLTQL